MRYQEFFSLGCPRKCFHRVMYIDPSSGHEWLNLNLSLELIPMRFEAVFWCPWSENAALLNRLMKSHLNPPILFYGFNKFGKEWKNAPPPENSNHSFMCIDLYTLYMYNTSRRTCTVRAEIFAVVLFSRISRVKPSRKFPLHFMSIYSNENISKIAKLTPRELPHLAKTAKITVRENNDVYSTCTLIVQVLVDSCIPEYT